MYELSPYYTVAEESMMMLAGMDILKGQGLRRIHRHRDVRDKQDHTHSNFSKYQLLNLNFKSQTPPDKKSKLF
jgi:hypothetical protein